MSFAADTILPRDKQRSWPLWGSAAAVVVAIHAAIGLFLLFRQEPDTAGNKAPDAIFIDLAPVPAPAVEEQPPAPPQEPPKAEEPPPQPEQDTMVMPDTMPEEPQPLQTLVQVPDLPKSVRAEVTLATPTKLEQPKPKKEVSKKDVSRNESKPDAKAVAKLEQPAPSSRPAASSADLSNWKSQLIARIRSFQFYPDAAKSRGESGTATVSFTIDRSGRVVSARLSGSSGSGTLDQAAVSTVQRASPMPAPPNGATVTINVPLRYSLR